MKHATRIILRIEFFNNLSFIKSGRASPTVHPLHKKENET